MNQVIDLGENILQTKSLISVMQLAADSEHGGTLYQTLPDALGVVMEKLRVMDSEPLLADEVIQAKAIVSITQLAAESGESLNDTLSDVLGVVLSILVAIEDRVVSMEGEPL